MWSQHLLGVHSNLPRLAVFFLFVGTRAGEQQSQEIYT